MNAKLLFDSFATIAAAPGGVDRVREMILLHAVKGSLVEQDSSDEPASDAISRGLAELASQPAVRGRKASSMKISGRGALHVGPPPGPGLPGGWEITALNAVTRLESGHTPDRKVAAYWDGPFRWLGIRDARRRRNEVVHETEKSITQAGIDNSATRLLPAGTVCLSRTASVGYVVVLGREMCTSQDFVNFICTSAVRAQYLQLIFRAEGDSLRRFSKGAVHQTIYFPEVKAFHVLLPPVAEQERILTKVDELMRLCDDLVDRQHERDAIGISLRVSSVGALTTAESDEDLHAAWARIDSNWRVLMDDPDSTEALRQSILQLAVMGKLVPQSADDEPAHEFLKRARLDRDSRVAAKATRLVKDSPQGDQPDRSLPDSWSWAPLQDLVQFIDYRGKTPPKTERGVPLITAKNIRKGWINREPREYVTKATYAEWMSRGLPNVGDVLFTTEAPLGNSAIVDIDEPFALAQRAICFSPYSDLHTPYLLYLLLSPWFAAQVEERATGMTATGIKAARLRLIRVPVPPVFEQRRIAAKVEHLVAQCEELSDRCTRRLDISAALAMEVCRSTFKSC